MMKKTMVLLLGSSLASALWAMDARSVADAGLPENGVATTEAPLPDSAQLEKRLQQLSWEQFKSVVDAVPKLKNGVDAYGPAGWQYVKANYRTYPWRRNIDRLDANQRTQLAALIDKATSGNGTSGGNGY